MTTNTNLASQNAGAGKLLSKRKFLGQDTSFFSDTLRRALGWIVFFAIFGLVLQFLPGHLHLQATFNGLLGHN